MTRYQVLTNEQAEHFVEKGYVIIEECLDHELMKEWTDRAFVRLGYDPSNPASWEKEILWMDRENTAPIKEISPKAWGALCDVIGGEERIETKTMGIESIHFTTINSLEWSDSFIVNFKRGADQGWIPPSPKAEGWHKDGSFFRHFLDSPEQALLSTVLWSDIAHQGGGTFIAPDSVRVIARYLRDRPEGVEPGDFKNLIDECREFVELTGAAGTFILMHPFMLHASSNNVLGKPRFMTNPPILLKEPMCFNRARSQDFSLLEKATLHALDVERLDFKPTAPRRSYWWHVETAAAAESSER